MQRGLQIAGQKTKAFLSSKQRFSGFKENQLQSRMGFLFEMKVGSFSQKASSSLAVGGVHSSVGKTVGTLEGKTVGTLEGETVGASVGSSEGKKDGTLEGEPVGTLDGLEVGPSEGS
jgi:hypothetical protein